MSESLILRANAKINLLLKVFDLRNDGFHEIKSDMQSISLHDVIILKPLKDSIVIS